MAVYVTRESETTFLDGFRNRRDEPVEYSVRSVSLIVDVKDSAEESCVGTVYFFI